MLADVGRRSSSSLADDFGVGAGTCQVMVGDFTFYTSTRTDASVGDIEYDNINITSHQVGTRVDSTRLDRDLAFVLYM